ncbi:MAG: penicillin-binding protein activator [Porticoccaceae bacterium]|nr:penicillin-binding protein activator [Porticoccaceae bacterium]
MSVQKTFNTLDPAIIDDVELHYEKDPLLLNIDQFSDQQKLIKAESHSIEGNFEDSQKILTTINTQALSNKHFVNFTLLSTENYFALFQMQQAATQLNQTRFKSLYSRQGKELKQRILNLKAKVAFANGSYYQGLEALTKLSRLAKRKRHILNIHDRIWSITSEMAFEQLDRTKVKSFVLSGWLDLASKSRRFQNHPDEQSHILSQWRRSWKNHPGAKVPPTFFGGGSFWNSNPDQIGVLLPLHGEYLTPSETLIQGLISAYYQTMNLDSKKTLNLPELRLYDTSKIPIMDVYNQAVDDGMEMIIGPMRQSEVEDLISNDDISVPTLTLNRPDKYRSTKIENLYQFGLSSIDELIQIADRAWEKGHKNILMIAPENSWGKRSSEFFNQYWSSKGGNLTADTLYAHSVNDFTKLLKKPLHIDLSEKRGLAIKRFINSRVNYTIRRRQDIDLVVMLGYPLKARQIKPALDFLYASNIPVIATSHIYNGIEQAGLDRDLSGVEFSSMPWALKGQLPLDLKPDNQLHTAYRQLFALGYDSFVIARNLNNIEQSQSLPLFGSTGLLSLKDGAITRKQKWAKFERGKAIEIY